ncbi:NmrA family NAD(P)-binding protein [Nocardia zapadnayensis]|uniref:NmrA family NAD(P)-binding protein n=1 Tax=Nocardia rhamnosiphila TaxID=426716 RepID=UPI0022451106|nr:NmrA family NAD(P)-binding protein [Nocardia zapadnayensis]MCX0272842.1 NmrA family NAD(P)-binding protein [Nocardia zapadnayensis]
MSDSKSVMLLVTGATGMQGGAVARAAHQAGISVTALVRNPDTEPARALAAEGIRLAVGDLEDAASLHAACEGCSAVFSVQLPPTRDPDSERRQGSNLVRAAEKAGVRHIIHTSVSGTGWRTEHAHIDPGPTANYWESKEDVEALVRAAGPAYTIVKPAFFLENFVNPKARHMFPLLSRGELPVASAADTRVAVIGAEEFGSIVVTIVRDTERFAGAEIELGSDAVTFSEIAEIISTVTGRRVTAAHLSAPELDRLLGKRSWSPTQVWLDEVGYPARPEHAAAHGLELTTTAREWAERHRDELRAVTEPRD